MSATEHQENFKLWFVRILDDLANEPNGGFASMMIALPLLERYLREKTSTYEERRLKREFYEELVRCFSNLRTEDGAKEFWSIFRNGILHQSTFRRLKNGSQTSGKLANCSDAIETDAGGDFVVNPVRFASTVVRIIEDDFDTFEGWGSPSHCLARVAGRSTVTPSSAT